MKASIQSKIENLQEMQKSIDRKVDKLLRIRAVYGEQIEFLKKSETIKPQTTPEGRLAQSMRDRDNFKKKLASVQPDPVSPEITQFFP